MSISRRNFVKSGTGWVEGFGTAARQEGGIVLTRTFVPRSNFVIFIFGLGICFFVCGATLSHGSGAFNKRFYRVTAECLDTGASPSVTLTLYKAPKYGAGADVDWTIRIYRKQVDTFESIADRNEHFDGMSYTDSGVTLIYEGTLPERAPSKKTYVDSNVSLGSYYAYWVSTNLGDYPVGPIGVKVRDPRVWWSQSTIHSKLVSLASTYPTKVTLTTYGTSAKGIPIEGMKAGNVNNCIALIGAIHAGESGPELIIPALVRILRDNSGMLDTVGIAILPDVNVDEREIEARGSPEYKRTTLGGIDINRNFAGEWNIPDSTYDLDTSDSHNPQTYRGPSPESAPETKAVVAFISSFATKPKVLFSFHHVSSIAGYRCLMSQFARSDSTYAERAIPFAAAYARGFNGDRNQNGDYTYGCTAGSLATWMYRAFNVPAFDLESSGAVDENIAAHDATTSAIMWKYQTLHYNAIVSVMQSMGAAASGASR
jgi:hypothetical protein